MILQTLKPSRVSVYTNTARKTLAQVFAETGADAVINGTLFNGSLKPVMTLKVDGELLVHEGERYLGYGWDKNTLPMLTRDFEYYDNFICCIALIEDGKPLSLHYPDALGGVRGRAAIGFKPDGTMLLFCSSDSTPDACSPEVLQARLLAAGCDSALMLDGGGSSQMQTRTDAIRSTRIPYNFICVWSENTLYKVQVGAFRERANAERLCNELIRKGYDGFISEVRQ
jgi:Exopolysaccharide biosynthesis protein related to N-acetylglucosamine-1-phosphodiester alpha-N-acetylglucosaminidase